MINRWKYFPVEYVEYEICSITGEHVRPLFIKRPRCEMLVFVVLNKKISKHSVL